MTRRIGQKSLFAKTFAAALVGGFVAGFVLWSRQQVVDRHSLFNRNPVRRLAALGVLHSQVRSQPGERVVPLLREYLAWEETPRLRRRAHRMLQVAMLRLAERGVA